MARSVVITDDFNRASLGANWSQRNTFNGGTVAISSSTYVGTSQNDGVQGHEASAVWVGTGTINADCYASIVANVWNFSGSGAMMGVIARASTDIDANRDYYGYYYIDDASGSPGSRTGTLFKVVNGTFTSLASSKKNISQGDRIEIECSGTTITGLINQVSQHSVTDSAIASGGVGLMCQSTLVHGDDFEGGNLVPVASMPPWPLFAQQPHLMH